jgi:hypothetical protein
MKRFVEGVERTQSILFPSELTNTSNKIILCMRSTYLLTHLTLRRSVLMAVCRPIRANRHIIHQCYLKPGNGNWVKQNCKKLEGSRRWAPNCGKSGELAGHTGSQVETIRYYEREGLPPAPARSESNYRLYGPTHVARPQFIRHCRSLDRTLGEIRRLLSFRDTPDE